MLGPEDVVAAFEGYGLSYLSPEWVSEIWQEKFSTCPDYLPEDFAENHSLLSHTDLLEAMRQSQKIIKRWIAEERLASWTELQEVDYKPLLALLYFYTKKALTDYNNLPSIELGIKAAEVYFSLLLIPGGNIYHIFQMALYETCLEMFTLHKYIQDTPVNAKRNKAHRSEDDVDDDEVMTLSAGEQKSVIKQLNALLDSLKTLVGAFSFKSQGEAMRLTLSMLAELTRLERTCAVDVFIRCHDSSSVTMLSKNAYLTIKGLCIELHGRIGETLRLALFRLLPNLSLVGGTSNPEIDKWPVKEQTVVRNIAVWFVKTHIIPLGADAHVPLKTLAQYLCREMQDKADYRAKATDMVVSIITDFPEEIYYMMLKWIFFEALNDGVAHRVVALELLSKLIFLKQGSPERSNIADGSNMSERSNSTNQGEPSTTIGEPSHATHTNIDGISEVTSGGSMSSNNSARLVSFCKPIEHLPLEFRRGMLAIILSRLWDIAGAVRAKAMMVLSDIISNTTSPTVKKLVHEVFIKPYGKNDDINMIFRNEKSLVKPADIVSAIDQMRDPEISKTILPSGCSVVRQVVLKCLEDRVNVRRYALALLVELFKINDKWMTNENLAVFVRHCRDKAMSIRKEMVGWVTQLMLLYPSHNNLPLFWVDEVLPQVADREIRVQENALQGLTQTVLVNIKSMEKTTSSIDELPWHLLKNIGQLRMRSFLVSACALWHQNKTPELNQAKISDILSHIGTLHDIPMWVLLASISEYYEIDKPYPVMQHYLNHNFLGSSEQGTANLVLNVLKNSWHNLEREKQNELLAHLRCQVKEYEVPPFIISQVVELITTMMIVMDDDEEQGRKEVAKWVIENFEISERHLEGCLPEYPANRGNWKQCWFYMTLLGCLADIHPGQINQSIFDTVYTFVMKDSHVHDKDGLALQGDESNCLVNLKATAVLTLSRMALRDNYLANKLISGLSSLMAQRRDSVLMNNIVVSVADIGERFPNLIEPLVPSLSLCLKSKNHAVKEVTLKIMTDLLQEEYLKPRRALVFHLLSLTVDPCPRTVCIVKFYITNCLLAKKNETRDQIIISSIFHYNRNYDHPQYQREDMTDKEEKAFDFTGAKNRKLRLRIYKFLLKDSIPIMKWRCINFICSGILNAFADEVLPLDEEVLTDALMLLSSKELLETDGGRKKGDDLDDDEEGGKSNAKCKEIFTEATKQANQEVLKKTIADTIIPICCKLRKRLTNHPKLLRLLYRFVRELVRDYKNHITDFFRDDKQFGVEILHDINTIPRGQVEEDDEAETQNENVETSPNHDVVAAKINDRLNRSKKRRSTDDGNETTKRNKLAIDASRTGRPFVCPAAAMEARRATNNTSATRLDGNPQVVPMELERHASSPELGSVLRLKDLQIVVTDLKNTREGRSQLASAQDSSGANKTISKTKEPEVTDKRTMRKSRPTPSNSIAAEPPAKGSSSRPATKRMISRKSSKTATADTAATTTKKKTSSRNVSESDDAELNVPEFIIPPPVASTSMRRQSSRQQSVLTPIVQSSKKRMPLLSSTPLVASSDEFESDISPVVRVIPNKKV